jgi:hypothetical protein
MNQEKAIVGFIGSGGIARSHAFSIEPFAEKGALRYSSGSADFFEFYLEGSGLWNRQMVGSNYKPFSSFPSTKIPVLNRLTST